MRSWITIVALLLCLSGFSQQRIDSIKLRIKSVVDVEELVSEYIQLASEYDHTSDRDSMGKYAELAYKISDSINYVPGKAHGAHALAMYYEDRGSNQLAEASFKEAIKLREKIGDPEKLGQSYNGLGTLYHRRGEYKKAQEQYILAKSTWDKIEDEESAIMVIGNIGKLYQDMGQWDRAHKHCQDQLDRAVKAGFRLMEAQANNNLGSLYQEKEDYEKAKLHFERALELYEQEGNYNGIAHGYNNLAITYFFEGKYAESKANFLGALDMRKKAGDPRVISESYRNLGDFHSFRAEYAQAVPFYKQALELADSVDSKAHVQEIHHLLSEVYDSLGDFRLAYHHNVLSSKMLKVLVNESANRDVLDMEAKYEGEKKARENEILRKEKEQQERITDAEKAKRLAEKRESQSTQLVIILVAALLALGAGALFIGYSRKQKVNKILKGQKEELQEKNEVIETKNRDITASIEYAQNLQAVMLPTEEQVQSMLPDHFILYKPRDIVSGDFYWLHEIDGLLMVVAADCTGHGVPGAFVSMLGNNSLNKLVIEQGQTQPGEVLSQLNREVLRTFQKEGGGAQAQDGMDLSLAVIDRKASRLSFAGAMNPLLVVRNGEIIELKADRHPIGGRTPGDHVFQTKEHQLQPGDVVYQFSDGYQDQFGGPNGKKFLAGKFRKLLVELSPNPMAEQIARLESEFESWRGDFRQVDDILVIGYRV